MYRNANDGSKVGRCRIVIRTCTQATLLLFFASIGLRASYAGGSNSGGGLVNVGAAGSGVSQAQANCISTFLNSTNFKNCLPLDVKKWICKLLAAPSASQAQICIMTDRYRPSRARGAYDPSTKSLAISPKCFPCTAPGGVPITGMQKDEIVRKLKSTLVHEKVHEDQDRAGLITLAPSQNTTPPATRPTDGQSWDTWEACALAKCALRMAAQCTFIDRLPLEQEAFERQAEYVESEGGDPFPVFENIGWYYITAVDLKNQFLTCYDKVFGGSGGTPSGYVNAITTADRQGLDAWLQTTIGKNISDIQASKDPKCQIIHDYLQFIIPHGPVY